MEGMTKERAFEGLGKINAEEKISWRRVEVSSKKGTIFESKEAVTED